MTAASQVTLRPRPGLWLHKAPGRSLSTPHISVALTLLPCSPTKGGVGA
jgi:hypothetical protein